MNLVDRTELQLWERKLPKSSQEKSQPKTVKRRTVRDLVLSVLTPAPFRCGFIWRRCRTIYWHKVMSVLACVTDKSGVKGDEKLVAAPPKKAKGPQTCIVCKKVRQLVGEVRPTAVFCKSCNCEFYSFCKHNALKSNCNE